MDRFKHIFPTFFALLLASTMAHGQIDPTAGFIDGTAHDMRTRLGITEICVVCHAPHNGVGATEGPLWNHDLTTQTFTRHGSTVTLGGSSKLCMSCHDGVTAVGSFGGASASDPITGEDAIGTDLTASHPIGVDYAAAITGEEFIYETPTDVDAAGFLEAGKIECGSCHHAHGGQDGKFLVVSNVNSTLCRSCHKF